MAYLLNLPYIPYSYRPNFLIETKLQEIKKIIKEYFEKGNDGNIDSVAECLTGFKYITEKGSVTHTKAYRYLPRISKWLLLGSGDKENIVKYDKRVVHEYFTIMELGVLRDASETDLSRYGEKSMFPPPNNPQLWKEMVNYCLSLIDFVDTPEKGLTLSYALYRFHREDEQIKELIAEKREKLIQMIIRSTKFPKDGTLLTNTQSHMCYWTIKLIGITSEKWNGILEHKTNLLDEIQECYLKVLVKSLPESLLERYYRRYIIESYVIVTAIFNMVTSCCLKNNNAFQIFEHEIASLDNVENNGNLIISFANIILNNPDIEIDKLMLISLTRSLKIYNDINVSKSLGVKLSSFLENNPKQDTPELSYSVTDFYRSLRSKLDINFNLSNAKFEEYCEMFESDKIRKHISHNILDQILDDYMKLRTGTDNAHSETILHCVEAFGKSSPILDKRMATLLIYGSLHYTRSKVFFDLLAYFMLNRGKELMALLDEKMCNQLEMSLQFQLSDDCSDNWFVVGYAALEGDLFWKIIEKSRQLENPSFKVTQVFKQGYTLELVSNFRTIREGKGHDPSFNNIYCLWCLLMENVEKSENIGRGKKKEIYKSLADLSLIERFDDWGHPRDSIFIFLFFAELEENVEENMNNILQNYDRILTNMQGYRDKPFGPHGIICRLLENIERFLFHYKNRFTDLNKSQREQLYSTLINFIGKDEYPASLLKSIKDLVEQNDDYYGEYYQ